MQPRGFGIGGGGGGNVDSGGYSGPTDKGGSGPGALDSLLEGAGNLLTDTISAALGNLAGNALTNLLLKAGVDPGIVNVLTGASGGGIFGTTQGGAGIPWTNFIETTTNIPSLRGLDPGGFGGGVLAFAQSAGISGQLAGELLKSKKVRLDKLLTGGQQSAISRLFAAAR
jgi:hypothetical protein